MSFLAESDDDLVDDNFVPNVVEFGTLVFALVSALIAATIVFEICKELVLKSASKYTKPIYDAMFSEMTILGFISLIAFAATYGSPLDDLSIDLFGTGNRYYISDLVDLMQGYVMWIMVMTMVHTLILLFIKQSSEAQFAEFNDTDQDEDKVKQSLRSIDDLPSVTFWSWIGDYFCNPVAAYEKHMHVRKVESFAVFHSLRREHLVHRLQDASEDQDKRLPNDFDFSMYLSISMSNFMANVVSCTPFSWFCVWILMLVMFAVMMASNGEYIILAAVLLAFDFIDVILVYYVVLHLQSSIELLVNPSYFRISKPKRRRSSVSRSGSKDVDHTIEHGSASHDESKGGEDEEGRLNSARIGSVDDGESGRQKSGSVHSADDHEREHEREQHEEEPLFPKEVDPNHASWVYRLRHSTEKLPQIYYLPKPEQSWISRLLVGEQEVNKHEAVLWGDKMTHQYFTFLFRMHMLFVDVSFPIALGLMVPYIFDTYGIWQGCVYLFLLSVPYVFLLTYLYGRIITGFQLALFSGNLRDTLMQNEALRILKMNKVLRLMIALSKISNAEKKTQVGFGTREYDISDPDVQAEISQIETIFDDYADSVGTVELNHDQLKDVVNACGFQLDEQGYADLFIVCDSDGNGAISKSEFVAWVMSRDDNKDEASMVAFGKHIFGMIDVDGSGEITLDEFRMALKKFNEPPYNAGFTDSEILSLLRDFDEDGDGNISEEEFLKAIEAGCNV